MSEPAAAPRPAPPLLGRLPPNVVWLGVVSGLTDVSSEMLYPIIPFFLTAVLGAPMAVVGLIEGVAEATASLMKAAGGRWSDRLERRKPFIIGGYSLSAAAKPLLALAGSWPAVLAARFIDRTGKGLRTSPRDALLAASAEPEIRGLAFGFHRAMDTAGAAAGPIAALLLLRGLHWGYRAVFAAAFLPAALGVLVLALFVREADARLSGRPSGAVPPLSPEFMRFAAAYGVFAVGNSSDVFLLLRARQSGFSEAHAILAYVFYNAVYAAGAGPAGALSDRIGRRATLCLGLGVFAAVYAGFARASSAALLWTLFGLYGLYAALTEGVVRAAVADVSEPANLGTAMGAFQGTMGLLSLAASVAAGELWDHVSPAAPFAAGAAAALLSALLLARLGPGAEQT